MQGAERQLRHQLWVTQNCNHKELTLPSWAAQGSPLQKTQDLRFEEELFLVWYFPTPESVSALSKQTQHWNI